MRVKIDLDLELPDNEDINIKYVRLARVLEIVENERVHCENEIVVGSPDISAENTWVAKHTQCLKIAELLREATNDQPT